MLRPFWRVTISVNDEPENLMILPPLDDSILDKIMLFKVARPNCLPTDALSERQRFGSAIDRELPAFIHFLVHEHRIRAALVSGRTGIKSYHNPELTEGVEDLSPEAALISMLEIILPEGCGDGDGDGSGSGDGGNGVEMHANTLYERIKGHATLKADADRLFRSPAYLGKLLNRLSKGKGKYHGLVTPRGRTSKGARYLFKRPRFKNVDRE